MAEITRRSPPDCPRECEVFAQRVNLLGARRLQIEPHEPLEFVVAHFRQRNLAAVAQHIRRQRLSPPCRLRRIRRTDIVRRWPVATGPAGRVRRWPVATARKPTPVGPARIVCSTPTRPHAIPATPPRLAPPYNTDTTIATFGCPRASPASNVASLPPLRRASSASHASVTCLAPMMCAGSSSV